MYRVIAFFIDLQDGEHPYNVGDAFPREGRTVSEERIRELSGCNNKRRMPLIELVKEEPVKEPEPIKKPAAKKEKNDRSGSSGNAQSKPRKKK